MHALTDIGEILIETPGAAVLLRPSLRAMAQLGDGEAVVRTFVSLFEEYPGPGNLHPNLHHRHRQRFETDRFHLALDVLTACADCDITHLTGHMGERYGTWRAGRLPMADVVPLARSLLRYGVCGVVPEQRQAERKRDDYRAEFVPRDIVAQAVVHLGMAEAEAWEMTVTSFILAMRAKYPPPESAGPSAEDAQRNLEWLEAINRKRDA